MNSSSVAPPGAPCWKMWRSEILVVGQVRSHSTKKIVPPVGSTSSRNRRKVSPRRKRLKAQTLNPEVGHALDHQPVLIGIVHVVQPEFRVRLQERRGVLS